MSILTKAFLIFYVLFPVSVSAKDISMSPDIEKKIAAMAAKDWGHSLDDPNNSFDELIGLDGHERFKGYYNIAVMVESDPPDAPTGSIDLAMNLAIRKATADVVEMNTCRVLRYPDLMAFRLDWLKKTGNKPVSLDRIQDEVDCEVKVVTKPWHK